MSGALNYPFVCPICDGQYGANDEMSVYDEEYDDHICLHCKSELDAEREQEHGGEQ